MDHIQQIRQEIIKKLQIIKIIKRLTTVIGMRTSGIAEAEDIFKKTDFQFIKDEYERRFVSSFFKYLRKALHNGIVVKAARKEPSPSIPRV